MNRIDQTDVLRQGAVGRFQETSRRDRAQETDPAATKQAGKEQVTDRAEISEAAQRLMEVRSALEIGRKAVDGIEDVREERVLQAKARLAEGYYQAVEVQSKVADGVSRVMDGMDAL
ncbi:MAG: hypothetical protein GY838_06940 [bacterium]|nr:hypothetical protein [bacterium]